MKQHTRNNLLARILFLEDRNNKLEEGIFKLADSAFNGDKKSRLIALKLLAERK